MGRKNYNCCHHTDSDLIINLEVHTGRKINREGGGRCGKDEE